MFIECCSNNIERTETSFIYFIVPFSHRKSCGIPTMLNSHFLHSIASKLHYASIKPLDS